MYMTIMHVHRPVQRTGFPRVHNTYLKFHFFTTCQKDGYGDEESGNGANPRHRGLLKIFILSVEERRSREKAI